MTITLRVAVRDDARAALRRDEELARSIDLTKLVFELDADDPRFARVLELTTNTSGCWLNPVMRFTEKELSEARFFQLDCRGTVVREAGKDNDVNRARLDALAFEKRGGTPLPIKLIDRVALSRIALGPNVIGCATDWMPEFALGRGVAAAFEQDGLTGYSLRPVVDAKGKEHADYFHLYSDSIMPAAELDATTLNLDGKTEEGGWRELGCLTYALADESAIADFNRTAENWSNSNLPVWVVRARVRESFKRHKLKGWAFRPVLEKGTPFHQKYAAAWSELLEKVSVNPRNRW